MLAHLDLTFEFQGLKMALQSELHQLLVDCLCLVRIIDDFDDDYLARHFVHSLDSGVAHVIHELVLVHLVIIALSLHDATHTIFSICLLSEI